MTSQREKKVLLIHPNDNVLVALEDLKAGDRVRNNDGYIEIKEDIAAKHKFPIVDLDAQDTVTMYGVLVGVTQMPVGQGCLLTTENLHHASNEDYKKEIDDYSWDPPQIDHLKDLTFNGYHRSSGEVGTRNYWLFVPMVFCENRNLDIIREALLTELGYEPENKYRSYVRQVLSPNGGSAAEAVVKERKFKNIDGIKFLKHQGGCGGTREDSIVLGKLLAGYADHPNVAGVTVLSLGCQHLQEDGFKKHITDRNPDFDKPLLFFEQQRYTSQDEMIYDVIDQTLAGISKANEEERKPAPLSKLIMGMECGGSDGFSGISANPTVGKISDFVTSFGGKVMLAEFPELFGAEQDLVNRMTKPEMVEKFTYLMKNYNAAALKVGSGFDMNPSPGNIRDGLITDAIKSLGAAQKGGRSPINDVLDYTEKVKEDGLSLLCTPGNDVESTTGLAGSGANMILFTTGLGTPTGNPITPTVKISSNTILAERMHDIIDFDTGSIIEGSEGVTEVAERLLKTIVQIASGEVHTKAELLGQDDFIPWKRGVSL
ncbi:UxaA family hydrolase [Membranihabitans marinus]|uniref:UxaA family hydrolase n=1 Tax=Membranihabitans marinus TaxID=1227546 RepID=UPI001F37EFC6|nr:altronate dehydratase family protein [Membranihabitans marinus]